MSEAAKRILLVEDSQDIQLLLADFLTSNGYAVACASNGQEAIAYLNDKPSAELPGLILLDLMMPIMDGYRFRQLQQKSDQLAKIPVIIMTADADIQTKSRA